ncbi:hypothetical protein BUALT_Bualt18G0028000 [Buddleja alternifolia]|uniref:Serine acetyltransferase N-terminal domain-containing protein n=1 Tax=Buddleja alternifolia TaxID=168488 RepID=A0AAV6W477_9LAMI|nr:hypothetical protein BUALT_Bualt18G0028000 [Buddleja alternifolia]
MEDVIDDLRVVKEENPACISHVQCYWIGHDLWANGRKALALLIQNKVSEIFSTNIHPVEKIGKGIFLDHGTGSMVLKPVPAESIVVGKLRPFRYKTEYLKYLPLIFISGQKLEKEFFSIMGRVGNGVVILGGTCALGNIRLENEAKIGAGSMVLKPVSAGSIVVGNPARLIGVEANLVNMVPKLILVVTRIHFIPFKHCTSTNAASIRFLFKHSTSTKGTYYETRFPSLSSPLPIHEKNSNSPGDDLLLLMKENVKLDVEQEPLLSEYYFCTILAHNSMEGALANSLSLKLSTSRLLSDTLYQIFLGVLTEDQEIMVAVIDDLRVV